MLLSVYVYKCIQEVNYIGMYYSTWKMLDQRQPKLEGPLRVHRCA